VWASECISSTFLLGRSVDVAQNGTGLGLLGRVGGGRDRFGSSVITGVSVGLGVGVEDVGGGGGGCDGRPRG
jgi:hypothetical protein